MSETAAVPESGLLAYFGPPLRGHARAALQAHGYTLAEIDPDGGVNELPEETKLFVFGLGTDHPLVASLQREAVRRNIPALTDLAALGAVSAALRIESARRVLITGSAGKTMTAALTEKLLGQGGLRAEEVGREIGYLNALGLPAGVLLFTAEPSHVRYAAELGCGVAVVLNLTEEGGEKVGDRARQACAELLTGVGLGILGTDDTGAQSLLMAVRRKSPSLARSLVPVSGGATLSDGWFALDRAIYAIRNGRTRRVADYNESAILLGDHLAQDAAAASALASHFGINDDQIAKGLNGFRGLEGRFDCIGTEGRMVFVDDRHADCRAATDAAIGACPEVFWIGHRFGQLPAKAKAALRGAFYLQAQDGTGHPVDNVVTFRDAEGATEAALTAARDLLRREPGATPVILFSPGAPGYGRQGDLFKLRALSFLSERNRSHG